MTGYVIYDDSMLSERIKRTSWNFEGSVNERNTHWIMVILKAVFQRMRFDNNIYELTISYTYYRRILNAIIRHIWISI